MKLYTLITNNCYKKKIFENHLTHVIIYPRKSLNVIEHSYNNVYFLIISIGVQITI